MKTMGTVLAVGLLLLSVALCGHAMDGSRDVEFQFSGSSVPEWESPVVRGQNTFDNPPMPAGGCGSGCMAAEPLCADPCVTPCWQFFGDYLLLRPTGDKVSFAVPINGAIIPPPGVAPVSIGAEAVTDPGFESGVRVGLAGALTPCSSLGAAYTYFESDDSNEIAIEAPYVLRSLVYHPGTAQAATDFLDARAFSRVNFHLVDIDFRRTFLCGDLYQVNYLAGVRYAHLGEEFRSVFTNSTTLESVDTDIYFDGGGIRFGLEGERRAAGFGGLVYAKAYSSFVGGEFTSRYTQADNFRGAVVDAGWSEDRLVTMLDFELGVGWVNPCGSVRLTAGWMESYWFNVITTQDFIRAVRTGDSVSVSDTLGFDGLVLRAELRY